MMDFDEFQKNVNRWAEERDIFSKATLLSQWGKTLEEVLELLDAIMAENTVEIKDAIGDILVTLVIAARMAGTDMQECYEKAWGEIRDRKGKMIDGVFVKEK